MSSSFVQDKQLKILEKRILDMVHAAGAGHPGGSLSSVGLVADIMLNQGRFGPGDDEDWLVLAKGHAAPALYAVLVELGFFPDEELETFKHLGSRLQGHPDRRKAPGVQVTTGHLGQGLSIGLGLALAERFQGKDSYVWVVLGEGDLHEGQTWEALMAISHYRVANLTVVIDANGLTQHDAVPSVMNIEPLSERLEAFGLVTREIDGHDPTAVSEAMSWSKAAVGPSAVIARTVKGHHVSFMENVPEWHSREINDDEYAAAVAEIEGRQ